MRPTKPGRVGRCFTQDSQANLLQEHSAECNEGQVCAVRRWALFYEEKTLISSLWNENAFTMIKTTKDCSVAARCRGNSHEVSTVSHRGSGLAKLYVSPVACPLSNISTYRIFIRSSKSGGEKDQLLPRNGKHYWPLKPSCYCTPTLPQHAPPLPIHPLPSNHPSSSLPTIPTTNSSPQSHLLWLFILSKVSTTWTWPHTPHSPYAPSHPVLYRTTQGTLKRRQIVWCSHGSN